MGAGECKKRAGAHMGTVEAIPPIKNRGAPASIILAESEDYLRSTIKASLETQGHSVSEVSSVEEALECGQNQDADLVMIDSDIPGGRDWNLLAQLEKYPASLVLITADQDDTTMISALEHGIKDQLTKPINPISLIALVESTLEAQRVRATLDQERERLALVDGIDSLTGINGQSRMRELLAFTTAAAARYDYPLSLVLFEADNLERINGVHGSDAADRVLVEIADHLLADLRSSDLAGRWEKNTFIVLLPHTDIRGARIFAERLRQTYAELPILLPNGTPVVAPASFGCAQGADAAEILSEATDFLLSAKRSGGNSVAIHE